MPKFVVSVFDYFAGVGAGGTEYTLVLKNISINAIINNCFNFIFNPLFSEVHINV